MVNKISLSQLPHHLFDHSDPIFLQPAAFPNEAPPASTSIFNQISCLLLTAWNGIPFHVPAPVPVPVSVAAVGHTERVSCLLSPYDKGSPIDRDILVSGSLDYTVRGWLASHVCTGVLLLAIGVLLLALLLYQLTGLRTHLRAGTRLELSDGRALTHVLAPLWRGMLPLLSLDALYHP